VQCDCTGYIAITKTNSIIKYYDQ